MVVHEKEVAMSEEDIDPGTPVDTHGHTAGDAEAQVPGLDVQAPAASEVAPTGDQIVRAQTEAEVRAQIENQAGSS